MKRGFEHWIEEGCKLSPDPTLEDPYAQEAAREWIGGHKGTEWNGYARTKAPDSEEAGLFDEK